MRPIVLVALAGLLAACSPEPIAPGLGDGEFHYRAATSSGRPLLDGRLSLTFPTDSTVAGTWRIRRIAATDSVTPVGPQVGEGTLLGTRHGDTVTLELNPLYADNNVGLRGVTRSPGLRGDWTWSTITGPRASGPFVASPY
jgi:hypothetical protein